jgi:hypothetical protein
MFRLPTLSNRYRHPWLAGNASNLHGHRNGAARLGTTGDLNVDLHYAGDLAGSTTSVRRRHRLPPNGHRHRQIRLG